MSLHVSSTMCSSSGGQKLYYTASGIITPIGGRPVHVCLFVSFLVYFTTLSLLSALPNPESQDDTHSRLLLAHLPL